MLQPSRLVLLPPMITHYIKGQNLSPSQNYCDTSQYSIASVINGTNMDKIELLKQQAGIEACKFVSNGMKVGLGTGSTVKYHH